MSINLEVIRADLFKWYKTNKRILPWRLNRDAYSIWLAEVIMQQTRVAQGTPYYQRFMEKFPDINALAQADEQMVLRLWQGLGYYSRARNMHAAATEVMEKFGGKFPELYEDILSLKGVGKYTAAAIASLAWGQPYAALDGNVYRVLSRLHALSLPTNGPGAEAVYGRLAQELLDKERPGEFNEAMMELGALVCTPKSPLCPECPLATHCISWIEKKVENFPVRLKKKEVVLRYMHFGVVKTYRGVYLRQRQAGDIWQGLYDFPMVERLDNKPIILEDWQSSGMFAKEFRPLRSMTHLLTHQKLIIEFYEIEPLEDVALSGGEYIFVPFKRLKEYPLPRPVALFLEEYLGENMTGEGKAEGA